MNEFQLKMSKILHNKKMADENNEQAILICKARDWISNIVEKLKKVGAKTIDIMLNNMYEDVK